MDYNQHATLPDLIADRHPLLVTVVAVSAIPDADRETVFTHYLLKVDQNIRGVSLTPAHDTSIFKELPRLDAKSVDILARQLGGTITERGFRITMEPPGRLLTKGYRYLLFLDPAPNGEETVICDGSTLVVSDGGRLQALSQSGRSEAVAKLVGKPVDDAVNLVRESI